MFHLKFAALLIFSFLLILPSGIIADKVVLDLHSDQANKWLEITCLYNEDYNHFWAYGYPVQLSADDDVYPNKKGFWTPGLAQRCEMHYYGGHDMPKAKSLTVGMFSSGKPELIITSTASPYGDSYTEDIGSIPNGEVGWLEFTFDLTDKRGYAFNFTMISMGDDLLLVDKIEFDLGDDITTPPTPPEPTTFRPILDNVVTLDTNEDYWVIWDQDCHYVEDTFYLSAYGCPVELKEEDTHIGYWNPCSASKACNLTFSGNASVLSSIPEAIRIRGYVEEGAMINITVQSNRDPICNIGCSVVAVLNGTEDKWMEVTFPVNAALNGVGYKINIELVPSEGGTAFVEKVELLLSGKTTATEPGSESSANGLAESKWALVSSILLITALFHLKT